MTKSFPLLAGTALFICLQAGCANTPATADKAEPKSVPATAENAQFPELKAGMPAALVRKALGEPREVKPMESTVGKAEVWVYNINKTVGTTQVVTGVKDTPAFTATWGGQTGTVSVPEQIYSTADKKADIVLSLLMINGKLIAQTSSVKNYLDYNQ
jgi:hypothetical protein